MPMNRRTTPTHRQNPVGKSREATARLIAHRSKIRYQSHEPEQQRNSEIRGNREYVPDQRATKLRLDSHGARIGKKPVGIPRTAQVQQWEQARAGDGKQSHGLRETIDRLAPLLAQQQQNSRYQGARMADADPPDEIDDREPPCDGDVDS